MSAHPVSEYGKTLYYPYFGVRNVDWLKASLLYWDGIRRIGYKGTSIYPKPPSNLAHFEPIDSGNPHAKSDK